MNEAQARLNTLSLEYDTQVVLGDVARPFARISTTDRQVFLGERYQGQLEQEPLTMSGRFEFPDTAEARLKLQEYEVALDTGAPVEIPGEYVRMESSPLFDNVVRQVLGIQPEEPTSFQLSSGPTGQRLLLLIEFLPDDGEQVAPLYADLAVVQSGRVETTLTNDHQPIPLFVKLVIDFRDNRVYLTCTRKKCPIAAPVMLHLLQMQACLDKPGEVRMTSLETGMPHGRLRTDAVGQSSSPSSTLRLLADLSEIQARLGQPILLPVEPFAGEELHKIEMIKFILEQPERDGTWSETMTSCRACDIDEALGTFEGGAISIRTVREESVVLFGQQISLGRVEETIESAILVNGAEARNAADVAEDGLDEIFLRLAPGSNDRSTIRFLDLLSNAEDGT